MKIRILVFTGMLFCSVNLRAQVLTNTAWKLTNGSTFIAFGYFDGDTLSFSADSTIFVNVGLYAESGADFFIYDFPGGACDGLTGQYEFLMGGDTLKFVFTDDDCTGRPNTFISHTWHGLATGTHEMESETDFSVYPNPANDYLTVRTAKPQQASIKISDLSGRPVWRGNMNEYQFVLDVSAVPVGMYFLSIQTAAGIFTKRFAKN